MNYFLLYLQEVKCNVHTVLEKINYKRFNPSQKATLLKAFIKILPDNTFDHINNITLDESQNKQSNNMVVVDGHKDLRVILNKLDIYIQKVRSATTANISLFGSPNMGTVAPHKEITHVTTLESRQDNTERKTYSNNGNYQSKYNQNKSDKNYGNKSNGSYQNNGNNYKNSYENTEPFRTRIFREELLRYVNDISKPINKERGEQLLSRLRHSCFKCGSTAHNTKSCQQAHSSREGDGMRDLFTRIKSNQDRQVTSTSARNNDPPQVAQIIEMDNNRGIYYLTEDGTLMNEVKGDEEIPLLGQIIFTSEMTDNKSEIELRQPNTKAYAPPKYWNGDVMVISNENKRNIKSKLENIEILLDTGNKTGKSVMGLDLAEKLIQNGAVKKRGEKWRYRLLNKVSGEEDEYIEIILQINAQTKIAFPLKVHIVKGMENSPAINISENDIYSLSLQELFKPIEENIEQEDEDERFPSAVDYKIVKEKVNIVAQINEARLEEELDTSYNLFRKYYHDSQENGENAKVAFGRAVNMLLERGRSMPANLKDELWYELIMGENTDYLLSRIDDEVDVKE